MSEIQSTNEEFVYHDPWDKLRQFTDARIGLGRVGTSIPTDELLRFQLSHAQAIDAVHVPLDIASLETQLQESKVLAPYSPVLALHSKVQDRMEYLQRPDLGRQLDKHSISKLQDVAACGKHYDLAFVIADGLSSYAVSRHAKPFLEQLLGLLQTENEYTWKVAPISLVQEGRVAVGDDVAEALNAKQVILLIGERPGLSSPDSMGFYLTWGAKRGMDDSQRNCISNIRPEGLNYQTAAHRAFYLLTESRCKSLSGVDLKDRSDDSLLETEEKKLFSLTHL